MKNITFNLKYVNKYGGASYKATDSRDTATIYISPNAFTNGPVGSITLSAEGFVNPLDVLEAKRTALVLKNEAKEARAAARAAARDERREARIAAKLAAKATEAAPAPAPEVKPTSKAKKVKPTVTLTPAPALAEVVNG